MTTKDQNTTGSNAPEDVYADWRTEIERIHGDPGCTRCYGRGFTGLSKVKGGKTMLVACRCMSVSMYPVAELVRKVVREELQRLEQDVKWIRTEVDLYSQVTIGTTRKMSAQLDRMETPLWRRIFK